MSNVKTENFFWNRPINDLYKELSLEAHDAKNIKGLSSKEVKKRTLRWGKNVLIENKKNALIIQYLIHFRNPLIIILLIASLLSAFTGEMTGAVIIWIMVMLSVTLDFVQEHHASQAAEKLKQSVAIQARVIRNDKEEIISISKLVPGDLVLLSAGTLIPADCRLLETQNLFVNQSTLTGESYPVEKQAIDLPSPVKNLDEAQNFLFMGTTVISGSAKALVCQTGAHTAIGSIAKSLDTPPPPTNFSMGVQKFGYLIMRLTILLVLFVFLTNAFLHRPYLESFLFAIALAVGLTPELLPMVMTVTLARGAMRMSKKKVIVKQLASIHNLGAMDILCTDKTGTLTEAHIHLEQHLDMEGNSSELVFQLAYLNSFFETGIKSPLDDAILEYKKLDIDGWTKIDEVPFDFERRRVSVLLEHQGKRDLVVKGAPEDILKICTHYTLDEGNKKLPLDDDIKERIHNLEANLAKEGFRVLGIAKRRVADDFYDATISDETELTFAGFAAFLDPPKQSAALALQALSDSGIQVKIITGDGELITRHIFGKLGISVTDVLTGEEINHLNDHALGVRAREANLMCRLNPVQKNRVIQALKLQGHTVGYLGDGINDAPSLQSADVGISFDDAVDVAKSAANMILLEQDLNVLHEGVLEGRRTFSNIMKYLMMGTSSNFGNMFSMAGATLFLPFLPMLPVQILANNLLYDISELPIPIDEVDPESLLKPKHWNIAFIRNFMLIIGPISSLFDFITYYVLLKVLEANEVLFHTGWFIESLASQILVIFIIRTRKNPFKSRPHKILALTSISIVLVGILLPFTPLAGPLGFVVPPLKFFGILIVLVPAYLFIVEMAKRWFYRYFAPE